MTAIPVFPEPILRDFVSRLEKEAATVEKWSGPGGALVLRKVAGELQALLDNPVHRWLTVRETAQLLHKSEETIRRWCRLGTAPFQFRQDEDSGEYQIWMASVPNDTPVRAWEIAS